MATSTDDAMRDAEEQRYGSMREIACTTCGSHWSVRFFDGEPRHPDSMSCHCGGEGEEL
jgi:hypothetical protein